MKWLKHEDKEENPPPTPAQNELLFSSAAEEDESEKLPSSSLLPPQACSSAPPIKLMSWWDSSNARKLFSPQGNEKALNAVNNQIKILHYAVDLPENLSSMINDGDEAVEAMSEYKVHWLHGKCQLLSLALSFASKEAPKKIIWKECCDQAVVIGKMMGITTAMHWRTIENWHHEFRLKRQFHVQSTGRDSNLPPFLQQNPDVCTMIKEYA